MNIFRAYYYLVKPGIIRANVMTATAGFLFGAQGDISWLTLLFLILGTTLVIAAGCVFNNILDRPIDAKMKRTSKRALVTGQITPQAAGAFASICALTGLIVLLFGTNWIVTTIGILALLSYVILYGYAKRYTNFGTEVGTLPGAASIIAGYAAATGTIQFGGVLLFLVMIFWQMPHFYAISLFRAREYAAANIPVLPLTKSRYHTWGRMVLYGTLFGLSSLAVAIFGYAGAIYFSLMLLVSLYWLRIIVQGRKVRYNDSWASRTFGTSLVVLLIFCVLISLEYWLP